MKLWLSTTAKTLSVIIIIASVSLFSTCSGTKINLTPDVIRDYGLDQMTLPKVQLYYRAITMHSDNTITHDEPTVFRRIDRSEILVSEKQSPAYRQHLDKSDIILIKNGTPCKIAAVLDSGRVLQADFGNLKLNFELSYQSGYTFELTSDTVEYLGKPYILAQIPLTHSVGILSVEPKKLAELTDTETRIKGKRVNEPE